jgi:hypothetical protein
VDGVLKDSELVLQPPKVKVEKLVTPGGASLRGVQMQLLESLVDRIRAYCERRLGGCESPHQLSLHGDDEV